MPTIQEHIQDLAAALEEHARIDEDAARNLADQPQADDAGQNTWRRLEAAVLERSARRYRGLAATMRWRADQAEAETGPDVVADLQRRLRRLRGWLIGLAVAYVGLAAGFLAFVVGRAG